MSRRDALKDKSVALAEELMRETDVEARLDFAREWLAHLAPERIDVDAGPTLFTSVGSGDRRLLLIGSVDRRPPATPEHALPRRGRDALHGAGALSLGSAAVGMAWLDSIAWRRRCTVSLALVCDGERLTGTHSFQQLAERLGSPWDLAVALKATNLKVEHTGRGRNALRFVFGGTDGNAFEQGMAFMTQMKRHELSHSAEFFAARDDAFELGEPALTVTTTGADRALDVVPRRFVCHADLDPRPGQAPEDLVRRIRREAGRRGVQVEIELVGGSSTGSGRHAVRFVFLGSSCDAGEPHVGANALERGMELIAHLKRLGEPALTVTGCTTGADGALDPGSRRFECHADVRTLPAQDVEDLVRRIGRDARDRGVQLEVELLRGLPAVASSREHPVVRELERAHRFHHAYPPQLLAGGLGSHLGALQSKTTFALGPAGSGAGTEDECLELRSIDRLAPTLANLLLAFATQQPPTA